MSRRARENVVAVLLLAVFAGVIYLCQDFGPRARMIPLPLAIVGIVLTLVQLVWQNLGSTDVLQMEMISVDASQPAIAEPKSADERETAPGWKREARAYGIVALFLALALALGPLLAVFVFTAGYFVLTRHYSWKAGLMYTTLFAGCVYLLFGVALGLQPSYGLLAPLFH
jgi:MFS family permease